MNSHLVWMITCSPLVGLFYTFGNKAAQFDSTNFSERKRFRNFGAIEPPLFGVIICPHPPPPLSLPQGWGVPKPSLPSPITPLSPAPPLRPPSPPPPCRVWKVWWLGGWGWAGAGAGAGWGWGWAFRRI